MRIFDHLHRLGARFHANRQTGTLARDVERGTNGIGFLMGTALFTLLPTLVEIGSVVVILVGAYDLWFAAIVAATFAIYATVTYVLTKRRIFYQRMINELDSAAGGRMVDSLLNYESVKVYTNEATRIAPAARAAGPLAGPSASTTSAPCRRCISARARSSPWA